MFRIAIYFSLLTIFCSFTWMQPRNHNTLITVGGGHLYGGPRHTSGILQFEYKFATRFWKYLRPQATLAFPQLKGVFFGAGIGVDCYLTRHLVFTPSFEPGFYSKGKSRDLGFPIQFRSSVELALEKCNGARVGTQFYHISNASLGHRNPGINAWVFFVGFPL